MNSYRDGGPQLEAQVWLWRHKVLLAVLGMLVFVGLLVSGNGL
jgi:hypothetical protein